MATFSRPLGCKARWTCHRAGTRASSAAGARLLPSTFVLAFLVSHSRLMCALRMELRGFCTKLDGLCVKVRALCMMLLGLCMESLRLCRLSGGNVRAVYKRCRRGANRA